MGKIHEGNRLSTLTETRLAAEADILQPVNMLVNMAI
jgi:hypothetical protein